MNQVMLNALPNVVYIEKQMKNKRFQPPVRKLHSPECTCLFFT